VPGDESTQANQAQFTDQVRSFYDPTYPDPGWIGASGCDTNCNGPYVWLLPRFQQWIDMYAPDLTIQLALSEYAFGDDSQFSPTLANAEVLAVMGVHKVAYSSRWTSPTEGSVAENAFKLYLNYDGSGSKVVGSSVPTTSSTPNSLNAYSVYDATTQSMYVLLFNVAFTADSAVSVAISSASLAGGAASVSASVWQMSAASTTLTAQASVTVANGGSSGLSLSGYTVPARSATLLVMKGVTQTAPPSPSSSSSSSSSSTTSSSSSAASASHSSSTSTASSLSASSSSSSVPSSLSSSSPTAAAATTPSSSAASVSSGVAPSPSSTGSSQTSTNSATASTVSSAWTVMSLWLSACAAFIAAVFV
jgi:hypothetical protein